MSGESDESKEFEPTQKRLDDARAKGEVPRSTDLLTAASYAGLLAAGLGLGGWVLGQIGMAGSVLLDQADRLAPQVVNAGPVALIGLARAVALPVAAFLLLPAMAVLAVLFAQRTLIFAPDKLMPKLSRLSPLATAKQKFGPDGLMEFVESTVKLCLVSVLLGVFLIDAAPRIFATLYVQPAQATGLMMQLMLRFLVLVLGIVTVLGGLDYLWQVLRHRNRNKMSRNDMKQEMKDSDGDPHVKSQRRQRGQEIALNRMLSDVATADVVVVNPTHYAVALKWDRASRRAPVCVAKGMDEVAARIREKAAEHGVPLHSDPPTARALHATIEVGEHIRPDQYRAVAAAIRFAETMRKRARKPKP